MRAGDLKWAERVLEEAWAWKPAQPTTPTPTTTPTTSDPQHLSRDLSQQHQQHTAISSTHHLNGATPPALPPQHHHLNGSGPPTATPPTGPTAAAATSAPPPPHVSPHLYGALVDGYMRAGDAAAAERVARRALADLGLAAPTAALYNTLMRGYLKLGVAGQARALELLQEMRRRGVRPGADTYTMLLVAAAEAPGGGWLPSSSLGGGAEEEREEGRRLQRRPSPALTSVEEQLQLRQRAEGQAAAADDLAAPPARRSVEDAQLQGIQGQVLFSSQQQQQVGGGVAAAGGDPAAPPSQWGRGRLPDLVRLMRADGVPLDGAALTALMMAHARAGRFGVALAVWGELQVRERRGEGWQGAGGVATTHAVPDMRWLPWPLADAAAQASGTAAADPVAWSALAAVHASMGSLPEAQRAAEQASSLANAQGQGAPAAAWGAVVRARCQRGELREALAALRRFLVLGGRPGRRLLDPVVRLCVRSGALDSAAKVLRAAVSCLLHFWNLTMPSDLKLPKERKGSD